MSLGGYSPSLRGKKQLVTSHPVKREENEWAHVACSCLPFTSFSSLFNSSGLWALYLEPIPAQAPSHPSGSNCRHDILPYSHPQVMFLQIHAHNPPCRHPSQWGLTKATKAGLELAVLLKTTVNFWSSCPHLLVSGIAGAHLHTICVCQGWNQWLCARQASIVPTEPHPQLPRAFWKYCVLTDLPLELPTWPFNSTIVKYFIILLYIPWFFRGSVS